jgi:hypothetical protein
MSVLVYINGLGPNYKGDNLYEFIFSETVDVWGENWDSKPANQYPLPPSIEYVSKVGVLKNTDLKLELIQNSDYFSMVDAMDDIVALAWENNDDDRKKRLSFRFGEQEQKIKDKLYENDLILEFEKKVVYEK